MHPAEEDVIRLGGERKGSRGQRGDGIPEHRERFAALQPVGVVARSQLGEAGQAVGDAFNRAQPGGSRANRREKGGQHCCRGFMAPIAE